MKWLHFSSLFVWLSSCLHGMAQDSDASYRDVMSIIRKYSKSIESEQGIILRGYGLYYAGPDKIYDGKIHVIDLGYGVDANLQYQEARRLFYSVVDGLLDRINRDDSVKQYFAHYPVGYQDLHFSLSFDYTSKGFLRRNDVDSIHILENQIHYFITEKDGKVNELKQTRIIPDVYVITDLLSNLRSIVRPLPEGPEALEDPADK